MTRRPHPAGSFLVLALAALASVGRGHAIEIKQAALNNTGAARYGQKLVLQSGPTVYPPLGSSVFDNRSATAGSYTLTLYYRFLSTTKTVAVGTTADVYAKLSGNSALVKSWSWTDRYGAAVARCYPVSSSVQSSPSQSTTSAGLDGQEESLDGYCDGLVSAYWTFYNATDRTIYIPSVVFSYEERARSGTTSAVDERFPADGRDNDIVKGGDFAAFFGNARITYAGTRRVLSIPPRGGVVCKVNPTAAPQDPSRQLFVVARGLVSADGVRRDTSFEHKNEVPESSVYVVHKHETRAESEPRRLLTSGAWRTYVSQFLTALQKPADPANSRTIARADVLIGCAQAWMNELTARYQGLGPAPVLDLLSTPAGSTDIARLSRVELAALLMNRAYGLVHPDDKLGLPPYYRPLTLEAAVGQLAARIASGSSIYQRLAYTDLANINSNRNSVYPCNATVPPPNPPSNLTVTRTGETRLKLQWADNSNNETLFRIERRVGTGRFVEIRLVGTNITSYEDTSVTVGNQYYYRVRAFRSPDAYSSYSNTVSYFLVRTPR